MTFFAASPYQNLPESKWLEVTNRLTAEHPLDKNEVVDVVIQSWADILESGIGSKPFKIGTDIFPRPQILAFLLHELVALEFARRHPGEWRRDRAKDEKDLVCLSDDFYSTEIKASSHASQVFGNRSYAQPQVGKGKSKAGFYITVNFEQLTRGRPSPAIRVIRVGWLDHVDWIAQKSATGQQARLRPEAYQYKLIEIFRSK